MPRGVVVLGMHRSGTSAATRLINLLGVPLPAATDLLPAAFDNPRGHWESASLVTMNDRVLAARDCDWTCPARFEQGWENEPALVALVEEAARTFRRVVPTLQWVWKDPRNCLLLPFWIRALGAEPAVVLVLRHPLEIAASLGRRDGFDRAYCLALWERYMRVCLDSVSGLQVMATTYHELLADPLGWCERTRAFLDRSGVETGAVPPAEVHEFIDARLRHSRSMAGTLGADPAVSGEQRDLAAALDRTVGVHDSFVAPALPSESASTEDLLGERRRALSALRQAMPAGAS